MIEKLVALIREKHRDSDSLIVADVLEQHGENIANEIVGAALCHLFGFPSPPDQGVVFTGVNANRIDHDDTVLLSLGIATYRKLKDCPADLLKRLYEHTGKIVYGESPTLDIRNDDGEIIDRVPLYKTAPICKNASS